LPYERSSGRAVSVADLDLDGYADIVIATTDAPDRLFLGAAGAFVDHTPTLGLTTSTATSVALVDVDHDGDTDVVTLDGATGQLRWRANVDASGVAP